LCETWVTSDAAGQGLLQIDFATATLEDVKEAVRSFWAEEESILLSMELKAPDGLKSDISALLRLAREGRASGEPATLLSTNWEAADRNIDEYMLQECGYEEIRVTATDHTYQGLPHSRTAATVAVTLTNQGQDLHQLILSRIDDNVTQPFSEILDQLDRSEVAPATPMAVVDADPGERSTVFVPLTPGRYGVFDAYPQGTKSEIMRGGGPPHFRLGMMHEFKVT
jgi:hypothetical protein